MYFGKYAYRPVDKLIDNWQGTDLVILKHISEGEYIDYKENALATSKVAKHLSAFANQHGGWLFFGIKEDKTERKAESFPGINKKDVPKLLAQISEVAAQAIHPYLRFEEKVINGPVPEIELTEEKAIVIIGIPRGLTPPHLVRGIIYRRLHDKSEPVKVEDYSTIKELWNLREKTRQKLENFTSKFPKPELSHAPEQIHLRNRSTWVHIFLLTDPLFQDHFELKFRDFVRIMGEDYQFKFDNFFSARDGFICRHKTTNNPKRLLPSLRWWDHGNVRISLPINIYKFNFNENPFVDQPKQYKFFREYLKFAHETGFQEIEIGDFSYFWEVIIGVTNKYLILNQKIGNKDTIYGRIILTEMAGVSPFFDDEICIYNSKTYGIPVVEDNEINIPEKLDFSNLINFKRMINFCETKISLPFQVQGFGEKNISDFRCIPISLKIMMHIANSVGLAHNRIDILDLLKSKLVEGGEADNFS